MLKFANDIGSFNEIYRHLSIFWSAGSKYLSQLEILMGLNILILIKNAQNVGRLALVWLTRSEYHNL